MRNLFLSLFVICLLSCSARFQASSTTSQQCNPETVKIATMTREHVAKMDKKIAQINSVLKQHRQTLIDSLELCGTPGVPQEKMIECMEKTTEMFKTEKVMIIQSATAQVSEEMFEFYEEVSPFVKTSTVQTDGGVLNESY